MPDDALVQLYKEAKADGFTEDEIITVLRQEGYSKEEIRAVAEQSEGERAENDEATAVSEDKEEQQNVLRRHGTKIAAIAGVTLFLAAGIFAAYTYFGKQRIPDNIVSLLPRETNLYMHITTDPESAEVKNMQTLVRAFPFGDTAVGELKRVIQDGIQEASGENPEIKRIAWPKEIVLAGTGFDPSDPAKGSMMAVMPLRSSNQSKEALRALLTKSDNSEADLTVTRRSYRGIKLYTVQGNNPGGAEQGYAPSTLEDVELSENASSTFAFARDTFVLSTHQKNVKNIIDRMHGDGTSITQRQSYAQISDRIAGSHLISFYAEAPLGSLPETARRHFDAGIETPQTMRTLSASVRDMVAQVDNMRSEGGSNNEAANEAALGFTVQPESDAFTIDYFLSFPGQVQAKSFGRSQSLAHRMPASVDGTEIGVYAEEGSLAQVLDAPAVGEILSATSSLQNIVRRLDEQYAFFLGSEQTGEQAIGGMVFTIDESDRKRIQQFLDSQQVTLPNLDTSLGNTQGRGMARRARIIADMSQLRTQAAIYESQRGSYSGLSCRVADVEQLCSDIKEQQDSGSMRIFSSARAYCAYAELGAGRSYCMDSSGTAITTYTESLASCRTRYRCPDREASSIPKEKQEKESGQQVAFKTAKEDGRTVYSAPLYKDIVGIHVAINNKYAVVASAKSAAVEVLKQVSNEAGISLAETDRVERSLSEVPREITSFVYIEPPSYLGLMRYVAQLVVEESELSGMEGSGRLGRLMASSMMNKIFEDGIGPFIRTIPSTFSYTERAGDMLAGKQTIHIRELPEDEQEDAEQFWKNVTSMIRGSLGGARQKATDARVIADMSQLRTQAEVVYSQNGSYQAVKEEGGDETITDLSSDINSQLSKSSADDPFVVAQSTGKYCAYADLLADDNDRNQWYCVDSTGAATTTATDPGTTCRDGTSYVCPEADGRR